MEGRKEGKGILLSEAAARAPAEGHEVPVRLVGGDEPAVRGEGEGVREVGGGEQGGAEVHGYGGLVAVEVGFALVGGGCFFGGVWYFVWLFWGGWDGGRGRCRRKRYEI